MKPYKYKGIVWITVSDYVDIETGEIIKKNKDYITIRKHKKVEINGNFGIIKYTHECEKTRQQKLF